MTSLLWVLLCASRQRGRTEGPSIKPRLGGDTHLYSYSSCCAPPTLKRRLEDYICCFLQKKTGVCVGLVVGGGMEATDHFINTPKDNTSILLSLAQVISKFRASYELK